MSAPIRKVTIDGKTGAAVRVEREARESETIAPFVASLRLHRKGLIEGYAQALMDTGPVPPTPELRDEWMGRYRQRAAQKFPETV